MHACLRKETDNLYDKPSELKCRDGNSRNNLNPGDCALLDQYKSSVSGHLQNIKGKEKEKFKYMGGTLAVDHGITIIFAQHQESLCAGNMLETKKAFEQKETGGVTIKCYRADNGIFVSQVFKDHVATLEQ
jgi:hypothetical protein